MAERVERITLRAATLDDIEVLADWSTRPHVRAALGSEKPPDWAIELASENNWVEMLIAQSGKRPIGFMEIIDPAEEPSHYWGDVEKDLRALDIWIGETADLNKGYGTQMMKLALARCFEPPEVKAVIIDPLISNKDAIRFYERLGFVHQGIQRFDGNECAVMRMEREDWACRNSR